MPVDEAHRLAVQEHRLTTASRRVVDFLGTREHACCRCPFKAAEESTHKSGHIGFGSRDAALPPALLQPRQLSTYVRTLQRKECIYVFSTPAARCSTSPTRIALIWRNTQAVPAPRLASQPLVLAPPLTKTSRLPAPVHLPGFATTYPGQPHDNRASSRSCQFESRRSVYHDQAAQS
ncbi:hypothetical protein OH76DRAFT_380092 [Lentinus brumalis]|uniref:Uncharacterized protein n=1 Tax=Lentinus brumalis TaxID=2498619 RepID=A0A371DV27_9APHY|nr:hypothetical protein OH76DRAFT_380092 [Polyporus brumalis]